MSEMMKCGCSAGGNHVGEHDGLPERHPCCIIHMCCEVVEVPDLIGRKARCEYYGKRVRTGSYNGNCCNVCAKGSGICK